MKALTVVLSNFIGSMEEAIEDLQPKIDDLEEKIDELEDPAA